ncbi:MAG: ORF6N domain-containing protein [Candidatus Omnitrophota bacterium]
MKELIPQERIERRILVIRGQKVMLDRDIAELYGVTTAQLTRQVRRNIDRFPEDFMFQLTKEELTDLMCQIGTSSWGGTRKLPYAFTEQGVAMLSGILRSKRAVYVNIAIMRAFVRLKQILATHKELAEKLKELEGEVGKHNKLIMEIFEIIKQLTPAPMPPIKPKRQIGFRQDPKWAYKG